MASLFDGTEELISRTLGVRRRTDLKQPSASIRRLSHAAAFDMVSAIYGRLVANYPGRPRSRSGSVWRRNCRITTETRRRCWRRRWPNLQLAATCQDGSTSAPSRAA